MKRKAGGIIEFNYEAPFGKSFINIRLRDHIENNKYTNNCEVSLHYYGFLEEVIENKTEFLIKYDYFEKIFNQLVNLKYSEMIFDDGYLILDGSSLTVKIHTGKIELNLCIRCHDDDIKKRNLIELNNVFNEILEYFNIDKRLIE